jgi:hypothetical protein
MSLTRPHFLGPETITLFFFLGVSWPEHCQPHEEKEETAPTGEDCSEN